MASEGKGAEVGAPAAGGKPPKLGEVGRTGSFLEDPSIVFPNPPADKPRAAPILFHEPSKRGDEEDDDHEEGLEEDADHEADDNTFTVPASMQKELMDEMQRAQASEEVYQEAGEFCGERGSLAACRGMATRQGGY